jgi:integrase
MGLRHQRGSIQKKSGAFYVVYRTTVDGERKQVWHYLCDVDRNTGHGSKNATAVIELAEDHMRGVNGSNGVQPGADLTVAQFWQNTYLPFITDNLKPSTVMGYTQVWDTHLKDHFSNLPLRDYRTPQMTNHLTALAKALRPRTLKHIKFLASGLFSHAVATGQCDTNPIRDAAVLGKTLPDGVTGHYTLEEIENIITALVDHVDCQLIMALTYFAGLRRGEIQGLQWGDIDNEYIHIRRNKLHGRVTTPKTTKSAAPVPIIEPVRTLLVLWRAKAGDGDWLFEKSLQNTARLRIIPTITKAKLPWRGFHAGRRGLGTKLRELTGNSTAAKNVLRHSGEEVTQQHYEARLPEVALAGMRLLEAKVSNK